MATYVKNMSGNVVEKFVLTSHLQWLFSVGGLKRNLLTNIHALCQCVDKFILLSVKSFVATNKGEV